MDKMGSQNGMDELEVIDADSQKVVAMLSALPRVEAPANFEFRVKAGIANGAPSRSALLPFLKTAAPLALIAFVVSFGLLYYQAPSGTEVAPLKDMSIAGPALAPAQTEPASASGGLQSSTQTNQTVETVSTQPERGSTGSRRASTTRRTVSSTSSNRAQGGGSVDRIYHPANVIMPPGTESANPQKLNANTAATSTDVPLREVLGIYGVEGDFADGGWKVRSIKDNSIGSRAKIAAGDVIESIDGQPVRAETKLKGGAKTFTVRRDGKLMTLSSGN